MDASIHSIPISSLPASAPLTVELAHVVKSPSNVLAAFAFGERRNSAIDHVGLPSLGDTPLYELWRTPEAIVDGRDGDIAWRATQTLLVGSIAVPAASDPVESTRSVYRQVLACIRNRNYPHLVRIWHFMPNINAGHGDDERYKSFNLGRALALDEDGADRTLLPAATAVGTQYSDQLLVYFFAGREAGRRLENPRQVSAFAYPRSYGLRSPLFSRASVLPLGEQSMLLVSGTASIVGHESKHPGDIQGQLQEIWRNLEHLAASAGAVRPRHLRVYIRHVTDYPHVVRFVAARLPADVSVAYLQADICRAELLVEVEGVYQCEPGAA